MNKEDLTAKDFLQHILEAADRVLRYTKGMGRKEFSADTMVQDAVIRNVEIIGEAASNLLEVAPDIGARYPSIPFVQIRGMRNRVAHGYFAVSLSMVWDSVEIDIPELRQKMTILLEKLQEGDGEI